MTQKKFKVETAMDSERFTGSVKLFGTEGFNRLQLAHVCVVGIGGVGSWAVEALARSGVGNLTLIDGDVVVESNINRQIHALTDTLGKPKVQVLAERIAGINPLCKVRSCQVFLTPDNIADLIGEGDFDFVIDAIDRVSDKAALIAYCKQAQKPLITVGSAGGQMNPTQIDISDLSRTQQDPLLAKVRKRLRTQYGFTRKLKDKFFIDAVYSTEPVRYIQKESTSEIAAENISGKNLTGFGTTMAVTAGFGLAAASYVLRHLSEGKTWKVTATVL